MPGDAGGDGLGRLDGLERLNGLPPDRAEAALLDCCGAASWARQMAAARPFASADELLAAADRIWWTLSRDDWLQAFGAHPRIGGGPQETGPPGARAGRWSTAEQAGVQGVPDVVRRRLAEAVRAYERRFGYIFIVCASGKSAAQMLQLCRARLGNAAGAELAIAAEEQRRITRLRLGKLLAEGGLSG